MKKDDIKNSCDMFLHKANIDLNTSIFLLKAFDKGEVEIDFELIYFHLQQSAEKLLKSLLSHKKIRVLKTHDISDFINLLSHNDIKHITNINELENLAQYAIEGRYAILHDDLDDAEKYIDILKQLTLHVEKTIKKEEN